MFNIKVTFTYDGQERHFERRVCNLDRNYRDEPYALFFESVNGDEEVEAPYFEINILKDAEYDGYLVEKGYVAVYDSIDDVMAGEIIEAKVEFDK